MTVFETILMMIAFGIPGRKQTEKAYYCYAFSSHSLTQQKSHHTDDDFVNTRRMFKQLVITMNLKMNCRGCVPT